MYIGYLFYKTHSTQVWRTHLQCRYYADFFLGHDAYLLGILKTSIELWIAGGEHWGYPALLGPQPQALSGYFVFSSLGTFFPSLGTFFPSLGTFFPSLWTFFSSLGTFFPSLGTFFPSLGTFFPSLGTWDPTTGVLLLRAWPQELFLPLGTGSQQQ